MERIRGVEPSVQLGKAYFSMIPDKNYFVASANGYPSIDSYAKITLLDLRYISSALIDDYVSFENSDVLFLYSTMLLNSAGILK